MMRRASVTFAVAVLVSSAKFASAQPSERVLSTRTIRSGETLELAVKLVAPHHVTITVRGGELGNSAVEYFTATEIQQWLAGRPRGPSPDVLLQRAPSAGLGEHVADMTAPMGDAITSRTLVLSTREDAGTTTFEVRFKHARVPLEKHEVVDFLRDIKRAATVADSLSGKKG